jgi:hypothetical protein
MLLWKLLTAGPGRGVMKASQRHGGDIDGVAAGFDMLAEAITGVSVVVFTT